MSNPFLDKTPTSGDDLGPPQYAWNRGNANAFGSPLQPSSISSGLSASSPAIGTPNTPQTQRGGFPSQAASTDEIPLYSSQSTQYATPAASVLYSYNSSSGGWPTNGTGTGKQISFAKFSTFFFRARLLNFRCSLTLILMQERIKAP